MSAPDPLPPGLPPWLKDLLAPVGPPILVSDFEEDPPITVRYIQGDNDLDFETVYRSIKTLAHHPGRGLLSTVNANDPEPGE